MPDQMITLTLPRNVVGQILDGLRCREQAYRDTAEYLETGVTPDPASTFTIEDVKDAEEARNLAGFYREIIASVGKQVRTASGREWTLATGIVPSKTGRRRVKEARRTQRLAGTLKGQSSAFSERSEDPDASGTQQLKRA